MIESDSVTVQMYNEPYESDSVAVRVHVHCQPRPKARIYLRRIRGAAPIIDRFHDGCPVYRRLPNGQRTRVL